MHETVRSHKIAAIIGEITSAMNEITSNQIELEFQTLDTHESVAVFCQNLSSLPLAILESLSKHGLYGITAYPAGQRSALSLTFRL